MILTKTYYVDTTKGLDLLSVMHEIRRTIQESAADGGAVTITIPSGGAGLLILDQADGKENAKKALEPLLAGRQIAYLLPKTMHLPLDGGKMPIELRQDVILVDYEASAKRREFRVQVTAEAAAAESEQKGVPLGRIG